MPERHDAQLRLCHEHIGGGPGDRSGYQWCDLDATDWCFDESIYVCSMHLTTRHQGHHTQSIADENDASKGERRKGDRRK